MAAYKDEARGTWYVSFHYNDWTGKNRRKLKRGFRTRKEALEYEQKFRLQQATNLDMNFADFYKLYEDDTLLAFYDIDPQAPVHFLVIPKQHIESAAKLTEADAALLGHIYATIANLCKQLGVDESGYRVVTNVGADGGQSVKHLHFHVLAKRSLAWPPG